MDELQEITIFDIAEDEAPQTKSQKQMFYEELEKLGLIPRVHYKLLYELENDLTQNDLPASSITSILLKWLLRYCVPIITNSNIVSNEELYGITLQYDDTLIAVEYIYEKRAVVDRLFTTSTSKAGGKAATAPKFLEERPSIVPQYQQFTVIGLVVDYEAKTNAHRYLFYEHMDDQQLINVGNYTLLNYENGTFTQQRPSFINMPGLTHQTTNLLLEYGSKHDSRMRDPDEEPAIRTTAANDGNESAKKMRKKTRGGTSGASGLNGSRGTSGASGLRGTRGGTDNFSTMLAMAAKLRPNTRVMFDTPEHAHKVIADLIANISHIASYYKTSFFNIAQTVKMQHFEPRVIKPAMTAGLNKINIELYSQFDPSATRIPYFINALMLNEINHTTELYYTGALLGIDSPEYLKLLHSHKDAIKTRDTIRRQTNDANEFFNKMSIMKSIALKRYNRDLKDLTKKEKDAIAIEYKAITSRVEDSSETKLFDRLGVAIAENDFAAIREIMKQIDNPKELEGTNCAHKFAYGKLMLEYEKDNNRDIIIRKYLIENFAQDEERAGYFCKFCGQWLAGAEDSFTMFYGERAQDTADDRLKMQIWKEATYIVMTNVKFSDLLPVKQIISSLSNGLRAVLASEEIKLYRSKTAQAETVRDTMSLLISIYIYAALCAMMITNPGKLYFARDKPEELKQNTRKVEQIEKKMPLSKHRQEAIKKISENSKLSNSDLRNLNALKQANTTSEKVAVSGGKSRSTSHSTLHHTTHKDKSSRITLHKDNPRLNTEDKHSRVRLNNSRMTLHHTTHKDKSRGVKKSRRIYKYVHGGRIIETTDVKQMEQYVIKSALLLLIISKEPIISRIRNMSIGMVKAIFANAYRWAMQHAKPIHMAQRELKHNNSDDLIANCYYNYLLFARRMEFYTLAANSNTYKIPLLANNPAEILDLEIKDIIDQFAQTTMPKQWHAVKQPTFMDKFSYMSFRATFDLLLSRIMFGLAVPRDPRLDEYEERYAELWKMEKKLRWIQHSRTAANIAVVQIKNNLVRKYNNFAQEHIDLLRHYCPDGSLHKIDECVYLNSNKREVSLTRKQITNWLESAIKPDGEKAREELAKFREMKLVDMKCSKCNTYVLTAKSKMRGPNALVDMFKQLDDINAFFQYYENRCPKGNLHEYVDGKCSCGYDVTYAKTKNSDYYKKYIDSFEDMQKKKNEQARANIENLRATLSYKRRPPVLPKYEYSLKNTAEWSKLLDVSYNILVNLGLTEGLYFEEIASNKINPSKEPYSFVTRSIKLKGHVLWVLRTINLLNNYKNDVFMHAELKELIGLSVNKSSSGAPAHERLVSKINTGNFAKMDAEYSLILTQENYCNFILEYLAGLIVLIHEEKTKFSIALAKYFTKKLVEFNKMLSKQQPYVAKVDSNIDFDDEGGGDAEPFEEVEDDDDEDDDGFDVENENDVWENE